MENQHNPALHGALSPLKSLSHALFAMKPNNISTKNLCYVNQNIFFTEPSLMSAPCLLLTCDISGQTLWHSQNSRLVTVMAFYAILEPCPGNINSADRSLL